MPKKNIIGKVLYIINVPGHIKRFYLRMKVKKHRKLKNGNKQETVSGSRLSANGVLNGALILVAVSGLVYINYYYRNRYLFLGSVVLLLLLIITAHIISSRKKKYNKQQIEEIILKDEDDQTIKKWNISNSVSLLIGKNTEKNEVDIDLSRAVYSSLISRQHAVMNRTGGKWYFEDMDSYNGSGIQRCDSNDRFKIESGKAYQVYSGDVVYIANTKLLLK